MYQADSPPEKSLLPRQGPALLKGQTNNGNAAETTTATTSALESSTTVTSSKSWPNSRRTSPDISSIWSTLDDLSLETVYVPYLCAMMERKELTAVFGQETVTDARRYGDQGRRLFVSTQVFQDCRPSGVQLYLPYTLL